MKESYPEFTFLTKSALRSSVRDQLVLLQNRTVALVIERQSDRNASKKEKVDHIFRMYNPMANKKRTLIKATDLYDVASSTVNGKPDSLLPSNLLLNVCTNADRVGIPDPHASHPTEQITVVLLDRSRSMSEKNVSSDPSVRRTNADMSMIMLGILCDNLISVRQAHAFGLIHFATSVDVRCEITRDHDKFEKALSDPVQIQQEWTCMYDAVNKAISLIIAYERNPQEKVASNCKKLIICISDGIDNYGPVKFEQLCDRLKKYCDIVVDFISFNSELNSEEITKVQRFCDLCISTGGYVYKNLPSSNIQLGAMFEQEAAVWLSERASRKYDFVEKPIRKIPVQLYHRSEHHIPSVCNILMDSARNKRLWKELNTVMRTKMKNITVFVSDDINFWKVLLEGPDGTPYFGGLWILYVEFGPHYPSRAPNVRFITDIFHVNISGDGKICHQILNRAWSSQTSMITVFENILTLLKEPNFDDAVSIEKAHLHEENAQEYDQQVAIWTQKYAGHNRNDLKRKFQLVDDNEPNSEP